MFISADEIWHFQMSLEQTDNSEKFFSTSGMMVPKIKVHHKNVCGIWHIWGKKTMRHQATFRVELFGLQFFNRLLMFKMDISATFSTVENKFMQNFAHLLEHQR